MKNTSSTTSALINFRDLGGLECADGRRIKPGKIFRSPVLPLKNRADRNFLLGKNLQAILDLRTTEEVNEKNDWIPRGCEYIHAPAYTEQDYPHLPVSRAARMRTFLLRNSHPDDVVEEKKASYRTMPLQKEAFGRVFSLMDQGKTFLFHCSAGKDRTGICAMFIEFSLGRTFESILSEYLKSDEIKKVYRRNNLKLLGADDHLIDNINYCEGVHAELLEISLQSMLTGYASPMDFLAGEYGVTPDRAAKWKETYLE